MVLLAIVAVFAWFTFPPKHTVLAPSFPDGTIPGAIHIHSTRSDGRGTLDEIAHAASAAGLKFIVVTDHGDATRAPDAPAYREGVLCLDAVEISTAGGHYIALDMPKAPYPLAGQARDVVEDVTRLGGFGIAAHPDSPKTELSWREWSAPFDAIEFVNPDTSWRQQIVPAFQGRAARPTAFLVERLFSYPFRPAESIAGLIQPAGVVAQWADVASHRRVVTTAGTDAHAQIAVWRSSDPVETRAAVPIPSYESSFRALSVHVRPERALTGEAVADAREVLRAIRAGHLYSSLDGIAAPPALEFSASNASGTAREGDDLPAAGGPVRLRVRSNAPAWFTTTIRNGAGILSGDHHEPEFTVETPGGAGVYWVEVRAADKPWLMSNPIYVRAANSPAGTTERRRTPAIQQQSLIGGLSKTTWHVEYDPTSLAALDLPQAIPGPGGTGGSQARLRFGLANGPAALQYAALVVDLAAGLAGNDRLVFTGRAEQPMRISVQLRSEGGSWARSVYIDTVDQERTVFFDDLIPVAGAGTDKPPRAEIRAVLFVIDAVNTRPGTSGRLWITNPALQR
jgi:hypothetical protein